MHDDIVLAKNSDGKYLWCKRRDTEWHQLKRNDEGKLKRCRPWRKFELVNSDSVDLPHVDFQSLEYVVGNTEEFFRKHFNVPDNIGKHNNYTYNILLSRFESDCLSGIGIVWLLLREMKQLYEFYKNKEFTKLLCFVENLCRKANSDCSDNPSLIDLNEIE